MSFRIKTKPSAPPPGATDVPAAAQPPERPAERLPKLIGTDAEMGNFYLGADNPGATGPQAAAALLREVSGVPSERYSLYSGMGYYSGYYCGSSASYASSYGYESAGYAHAQSPHGSSYYSSSAPFQYRSHAENSGGNRAHGQGADSGASAGQDQSFNPQDWGRRFLLENGGCAYIDLGHLEICTPEVLSAYDFVAVWHAMLRIAQHALKAANQKTPRGQKIIALANNTDGHGSSYGSHINTLITRRAWNNLFRRKLHYLLFLASHKVSSIIYTGQGKVGAESGAAVDYQISQRADFFTNVVGLSTTFQRGIVNSRDETLCGPGWSSRGKSAKQALGMARKHTIFYDQNLCQAANLNKVGALQIILAMIEAGRINRDLILDDPVAALRIFSRDPTLQARAPLASGKEVTAVELQVMFLQEALSFIDDGGCDGIVPRARDIAALWQDTLEKFMSGDLYELAPRCDWILKKAILERAMSLQPGLNWESPEIKQLDHQYSSLDPETGLFWIYDAAGVPEKVIADSEIERFCSNPPSDTRAWARTMLMRKAGRDAVESVNWDSISIRQKAGKFYAAYKNIAMHNPLGFTQAQCGNLFEDGADLGDILTALDASETNTCSASLATSLLDSDNDNDEKGEEAGAPCEAAVPCAVADSCAVVTHGAEEKKEENP